MRKAFDKMIDRFLAGMFLLMILIGCTVTGDESSGNPPNSTEEFKKYWYAGKAELTHYHLEQARYGEIHSGDAVLIWGGSGGLGSMGVARLFAIQVSRQTGDVGNVELHRHVTDDDCRHLGRIRQEGA